MSANPLEKVEQALLAPRATGVFVVEIVPGGGADQAGVEPADIVTAVGGTATPDVQAFLKAIQPVKDGPASRELQLVRPDGVRRKVLIPAGRAGLQGCSVAEGVCAWRPEPDSVYEPDFSAFARNSDLWLRTSFGEERAGYERVFIRRAGDIVTFDHLTHFGGEAGPGQTWTYRSQVISTHRLDRVLTTVAVESWAGTKEEGQEVARAELKDGRWRGEKVSPKGEKTAIDVVAAVPEAINIYASPLLALTMPLHAGARLTFSELRESSAMLRSRSRLECLGKEDVKVDGKTVGAWCFAWRQYGQGNRFERFWVSEERRLVKIEWGENYGGCWCEEVKKADVAKGLPKHVKVG